MWWQVFVTLYTIFTSLGFRVTFNKYWVLFVFSFIVCSLFFTSWSLRVKIPSPLLLSIFYVQQPLGRAA